VRCSPLIAGLALGWYLMLPPIVSEKGKTGVGVNRPLREWRVEHAFDSAQNCEAAREQGARERRPPLESEIRSDQEVLLYTQFLFSQCIASNDGRLSQ
jgi:hypothetical protein